MAVTYGAWVLTDIAANAVSGSGTFTWTIYHETDPESTGGLGGFGPSATSVFAIGPCSVSICCLAKQAHYYPQPPPPIPPPVIVTYDYHFQIRAVVATGGSGGDPPYVEDITDFWCAEGEDGTWHTQTMTFGWSMANAVRMRHGSQAISGEHGVVSAKENYGGDEFFIPNPTLCMATCSAGGVTATVTENVVNEPAFTYQVNAALSMNPDHLEETPAPHYSLTDLTFNGQVVDLSEYTERVWLSVGDDDFSGEGVAGGVNLWISAGHGDGFADYPGWGTAIRAPYHYHFALEVVDMKGVSVPDLVVWCSGVLDNDGNPVGHTVAGWNALDFVQTRGLICFDSVPLNPENASGTVKFWADRDNMIALGLEVGDEGAETPADTATLSFDHDGRLIIDGWFVSATSRTESPYRTDIATIVHRDNVSLYGPGPALAHTDWVGDGVTTPDAGGNFEVTEVGGTLTLTIPQNYTARQAAVGNVGSIAIPTAYWVRKADGQYSLGSPPEDHEGVYCWLGFGYLRQNITTPAACNVAMSATYHDAEVFTDSHISDERQDDYEYDAGASLTFTTTTPLASGVSETALWDLCNPDHAFCLVTTLQLTFDTVGVYQFTSNPLLCLDPGDTQTTPARAAVTPHARILHKEHFRYREGGVSAVVDGVYDRSVWWPDQFSPYDNQLERYTGGMYLVVLIAGGSIDGTTCLPLESYLSLMELCGDHTITTYSAANATAALTRDGHTLTVLAAWDLKQRVPEDGEVDDVTGLPVAVRVGQWNAVRGLPYTFTVRHVVKGRIHGWVTDEAGKRARNVNAYTPAGELYRRHFGGSSAYTEDVEAVVSDGHGGFATSGLRIVDTDHAIFDYAIKWEGSEDYVTAGRLRTREWAVLLGVVTGGVPCLAFSHHAVSRTVLCSDVRLAPHGPGHTKIQRKDEGLTWWSRTPMTTDADYVWGNIVAAHDRTEFALGDAGNSYLRHAGSLDGTWGAAESVGAWLAPHVIERHGRFELVAIAGGEPYFLTREKASPHAAVGSAVQIANLSGLARNGCLAGAMYGALMMCAVEADGQTQLYTSTNTGASWVAQHTLVDWRYPYLYADDPYLWLVGYRVGAYEGATGEVVVCNYLLNDPTLPVLTAANAIGACDEGRPAIIRRPSDRALIIVAPKTQDWTAPGATPGIAEYRSRDSGLSWDLTEIHSLVVP